MKQASANLINLLNTSDSFLLADLLVITLTNGTNLYYTNYDRPLTIDGNVYKQLVFKRDELSWQSGLAVETFSLEIYPDLSIDLISGVSMTECFRNGTFDGAYLNLKKAFFTDPLGTPEVLDKLFYGRIDVDEVSSSTIKATAKSITELLNIKVPRNLYQPQCSWVLYGAGCNVNQANFTVNSSVLAGSTKTLIKCGLSQGTDYFTQGAMVFTSGKNYNLMRTIKAYTTGQVVPIHEFPYTPEVGDTFSISRGCNKTLSDCTCKFNNIGNFGGQPYIPLSEIII